MEISGAVRKKQRGWVVRNDSEVRPKSVNDTGVPRAVCGWFLWVAAAVLAGSICRFLMLAAL